MKRILVPAAVVLILSWVPLSVRADGPSAELASSAAARAEIEEKLAAIDDLDDAGRMEFLALIRQEFGEEGIFELLAGVMALGGEGKIAPSWLRAFGLEVNPFRAGEIANATGRPTLDTILQRGRAEMTKVRRADDVRSCLGEAVTVDTADIGRNRTSLELRISNRLDWAIAAVRVSYRIVSPGRSVPWDEDNSAIAIAGGIEPGETRAISTWINLPAQTPAGATAEVSVIDVADPERRQLIGGVRIMGWPEDASPFACDPVSFVPLASPVSEADQVPPELSTLDVESLFAAIRLCWQAPSFIFLDESGALVTLSVEFTSLGEVVASSIRPTKIAAGKDPQLFEVARRALIRCAPFDVIPMERAGDRLGLKITFDPDGPQALIQE